MSDPSQSEAHASAAEDAPALGPLQAQRVAHIVDLKMRLRYRYGTAQRLASEWGLTVGHVHDLASEANKVVRRLAVDPDALAADLLPDLLRTYKAASRSVRRKGDPHAQAKMAASVASLGTLLAEIGGLKAPKTTKTELTGADGGPVQVQTGVLILPPETDE